MKLKLLTAIIIAMNVLLLNQDIPLSIVLLTIISLGISFFIRGRILKSTLKIILLFGSMALLRYHFKTLLVTECGVSFVLILSSLKFWELEEERDHFNMFLILALGECSIFLLNPTFLIFCFGLSKMLFYFYYILRIRNYDISFLNIKRLLILVTPAIFFSLVLFYTFPRFTQGFISANDLTQVITGGNSKINFKELGPLAISREPAFKVYGLEKSRMPFNLLYWRSSVLWQFSDQTWQTSNNQLKWQNPISDSFRFKYDVEIFQNYKEFLPTLDGTSSIIQSSLNFNSYGDGSFKVKGISRENLNYTVVGNYGERNKNISPLMERKGLKLKSSRSEEIKKAYFKGRITNQSSDEERLKELIQVFKNKGFEYSTNPPIYPSLEDFILKGSLGYCSHFAAAFTYLARIHDLPSRMVVGYLGGEFNPYDNSVMVRELDAHAWVEVYIKEKGWVKVDPTTLVAPDRAIMSAEEFNNKIDPYITILNFKISRGLFSFTSINNFSLWLDSLNSKFNTNIFNFDRDKQLATLRALTPGKLPLGWLFSISLCIFMLVSWAIFHYLGKSSFSSVDKRYARFLKKMSSQGLSKAPHETISHFKERSIESYRHKVIILRKK